ncbi:MAG: hypothetical protein H6662_11065 [Ardenticatenaceae bacterium]|nr:hypothetical protein [Anaerolineales bacterium]MCB8922115.1 hypothetical protein [Ardenticatenaceae bacterium]MCB9003231.1 hypothetical protein [Ardenticatenaceae bacterium]
MFKEKRVSVSQNRPGCFAAFAVFWLAISLPIFLIALRDGEMTGILIGGLFVAIGVAILGYALLVAYTRARIGKPEILLSNTTLRVGETFTVSYLHTFKRDVTVGEIHLQLIFRETATYQQGTDTRTVTHDHMIDERTEPGGSFQAGSLINQTYEFQIPPDGMHNLDVRRNKLQWILRMKMSVPRLPDFVEQIDLDVVPEMA